MQDISVSAQPTVGHGKSIEAVFFIKVAIDFFLIVLAYFFSYLVRFEFSLSS